MQILSAKIFYCEKFHTRLFLYPEIAMAVSATPSFYVNATSIDFESIASMEDEAMKSVFLKIAASGLRGFFDLSSQEVFASILIPSFENRSVTPEGQLLLDIDGHRHLLMKTLLPPCSI